MHQALGVEPGTRTSRKANLLEPPAALRTEEGNEIVWEEAPSKALGASKCLELEAVSKYPVEVPH